MERSACASSWFMVVYREWSECTSLGYKMDSMAFKLFVPPRNLPLDAKVSCLIILIGYVDIMNSFRVILMRMMLI